MTAGTGITYKKLRRIVFTQEEKIEKYELVWLTYMKTRKQMCFLQTRRQKRGIGLDASEYISTLFICKKLVGLAGPGPNQNYKPW
jgi:hypothetical protein